MYEHFADDQLWEDFRARVRDEGLRGALRFLNGRTGHRFTGVYRVDPPTLRNVQIFDELNPDLVVADDTPLSETYCSIVAAEGAPFSTSDAGADERLVDHPALESVRAYMGVPLTVEGQPFGTLCHFDVVPREVSDEAFAFLERAADVINEIIEEGRG